MSRKKVDCFSISKTDHVIDWLINYNLDGLITQGVPCILARVPRNAGGKGGEDVEKGPSDDDIVVGT